MKFYRHYFSTLLFSCIACRNTSNFLVVALHFLLSSLSSWFASKSWTIVRSLHISVHLLQSRISYLLLILHWLRLEGKMCIQCSSSTVQAQRSMNILSIEWLIHTAFSLCQPNRLHRVISHLTLYTLHSIVSYQCKKSIQFDHLHPYKHRCFFSDISDKSMRGLSLTSYTRGIYRSYLSYHVVLFSDGMCRSK